MSSSFRIEALSDAHDRSGFRCGQEALDRYFQTLVTQDIRRRITNCFVAVDNAAGGIAAFYTLAATSILITELPADIAKRLPRYPTVPAVRVGRLAVDQRFQKLGLGAALLADAARRTLRADAAAYALVVDAKDDQAAAFYRHHGFELFPNQPRTLFLPMATAAKVLI